MKIEMLPFKEDVQAVRWNLRAHPELWNEHTLRTANPDSPHHGLDDIWCRYSENPTDHDEHVSEWYPSAALLGIKDICNRLLFKTHSKSLGGVLITRIPAGKECRPHSDQGWHAKAHEKFAVQIESAPGQRFCFEGEQLEPKPGDIYWFDNQYTHWVANPTPYERVTMIVCVRR